MTARLDTRLESIGYILWIFGFSGAHRPYLRKAFSGLIHLLTFGLGGSGVLSDFWTLDDPISVASTERSGS